MRHTFRVGASHDAKRRVIGIGLVHHCTTRRRRDGRVIAVYSESYDDVPPGLMEKFAIYRALEIAKAQGIAEVKIRSAYNRMRTTLKEDHRAGTLGEDRDVLHRRVLQAAREFDSVRFAWVPRRRNQEARRLARHTARFLRPESRPDIPWAGGPAPAAAGTQGNVSSTSSDASSATATSRSANGPLSGPALTR